MVCDIGVVKIFQTVQPVLHRMIIQMPVIQIIAYRVAVAEHIDVLVRCKVNDLHIGRLALCEFFGKNHTVYHMF